MQEQENHFLEALRRHGLNVSDKECEKLKNIAVRQYKREQVMPVFKQEKWYHYVCLLMSWLNANYEIMFWIDEKSTKHKLKQEYKKLKLSLRRTLDEFVKINKDHTELLNAYESYSDDLMEMLHVHLDAINKQ